MRKTGITDPALLRASHIVPWAECGDAQRLDVHNGLLLSALWWVMVILWVWLMIMAFVREDYRLPFVGDFVRYWV